MRCFPGGLLTPLRTEKIKKAFMVKLKIFPKKQKGFSSGTENSPKNKKARAIMVSGRFIVCALVGTGLVEYRY